MIFGLTPLYKPIFLFCFIFRNSYFHCSVSLLTEYIMFVRAILVFIIPQTEIVQSDCSISGHKSLYGPQNSWVGHIGIINKTNFGWKQFFVQICFCRKKLLLGKKCWDFRYNKQITKWWLGQYRDSPQAIWPWPQTAINPCMALVTML